MRCSLQSSFYQLAHIDEDQESLLRKRSELLDRLDQVEGALDSCWDEPGEGDPPAEPDGAESHEHRPEADGGKGHCGITPAVIRGTNPHVEVVLGIDWLRLSGPGHTIEGVRDILRSFYQCEPESCKGLFLYTKGEAYWGGVVKLLWDDEGHDRHRGRFTVEIPGSGLHHLNADRRVELLGSFLRLGLRATRIDVAIDLVGDRAGSVFLVDEVLAACQRKELVGARLKSVRPIMGVDASTGVMRPETVYLGKRGDEGSGRFVRCYDKGMEQGFGVPHWWHRWEVEFGQDAAEQVAVEIAEGVISGEVCDWTSVAIARAMGAVDFKVVTGARDSYRRPRAAWWAAVVELVDAARRMAPQRVKARRRFSSLRGYRFHIRRAVLPTVFEMARLADCSPVDIFEDLARDYRHRPMPSRPVLAEFEASLACGFEEGGAHDQAA